MEVVVAWETTASLGILDILLIGYRITDYCLPPYTQRKPMQCNPQDGNDSIYSMDEMNDEKEGE